MTYAWKAPEGLRINKGMAKDFPGNCPVIERDGDGKECGSCWFSIDPKYGICPRHGQVRIRLEQAKEL